MRVAMIAAGNPRFCPSFEEFIKQIKGYTEIDLYFYLWNKYYWSWQLDYCETERGLNYEKINSILPSNVRIKKAVLVDEPENNFFLTDEEHTFIKEKTLKNITSNILKLSKHSEINSEENINILRHWWKKIPDDFIYGIFKQFYSLKNSFDLVEDNYDVVIRFRLDACLDKELNLNEYDMNVINLPNYPVYTINHRLKEVCDQFAFSNQENMKKYFDFYLHLKNYLMKNDSSIAHQETLLSEYFEKNNIDFKLENFSNLLFSNSILLTEHNQLMLNLYDYKHLLPLKEKYYV